MAPAHPPRHREIAAAAALWLAEHWDIATYLPATVGCASKRFARRSPDSRHEMGGPEYEPRRITKEKIGQGAPRAFDALAAQPLPTAELQDSLAAAGGWNWPFSAGRQLRSGVASDCNRRRRMLALELTQMAQRVPEVEAAIAAPEPDPGHDHAARVPAIWRRRWMRATRRVLRVVLETLLGRTATVSAAAPEGTRIRRKIVAPSRRAMLRVECIDPQPPRRRLGLDDLAPDPRAFRRRGGHGRRAAQQGFQDHAQRLRRVARIQRRLQIAAARPP